MQIITYQNGFYFSGKALELKAFLKDHCNNKLTVKQFIILNLQ